MQNAAQVFTKEAIAAAAAATTAAFISKSVLSQQNDNNSGNTSSVTIQLDSLANEIEQLQNTWTDEYVQAHQHIPQAGEVWAEEYVNLKPELEQAWETSNNLPTGQEFVEAADWVQEYGPANTHDIKATDFLDTVEKLGTTEQNLAENWVNEYEFQFGVRDVSNEWSEEFVSQENRKQEFWQKLQNEWDQLAEQDAMSNAWLSSSESAITQEYKFTEENPFENIVDPLSEGKRRLAEGDIPNAVLAFEASVQKNPENSEAWTLLGTTQAQNEQDPLAISALNQSLKIQPQNVSALLALGASLTNEAFQLQAAQSLNNWLKANPKYSHLVKSETGENMGRLTSVLSKEELHKIQESFIAAARLNPHEGIDPDVQSGLGILFNLGNEYSKATDCFETALNLRPNDSLLWNRLGATLANGGKSPEAINAYRRALELSPGFIRTRYNLGISCINLNSYKEAAEHFLTALNQQASGKKNSLMSESIWNSLRMVLHLMDKGHLTGAVDGRDLDKLNREFKIMS